MEITIKNMVCDRCIAAVQHVFEELQVSHAQVKLGQVELVSKLTDETLITLDQKLHTLGFERVVSDSAALVERLKSLIIDVVQSKEISNFQNNWSSFLAEQMNREYQELSSVFAKTTGTTIEQYIIAQKIEKAKELLALNQLTAAEIAFELGYSSAAHFSNQFKKSTGQTPKHFSKSPFRFDERNTLDKIV